MWNITICDDEKDICVQTEECINRFAEESGEKFVLTVYNSAEDMLSSITDATDILLLDIKMEVISGMQAAKILRGKGYRGQIIFITTMTQYAMEGYEVHAFGFLKKPVKYEQLRGILQEAVANLKKRKGVRLELSSTSGTDVISSSDIIYIESFSHTVQILLKNGSRIKHTIGINELEKMLPQKDFFRVHKSYIVNLNRIVHIDLQEITMQGKNNIPLSRHRRKEFLMAFAAR